MLGENNLYVYSGSWILECFEGLFTNLNRFGMAGDHITHILALLAGTLEGTQVQAWHLLLAGRCLPESVPLGPSASHCTRWPGLAHRNPHVLGKAGGDADPGRGGGLRPRAPAVSSHATSLAPSLPLRPGVVWDRRGKAFFPSN